MMIVPLLSFAAMAQASDDAYTFVEASQLNLIGKIHKETPNPYHRVDTDNVPKSVSVRAE